MYISQSDFLRGDKRISRRPLALALSISLGLGSIPLAGFAATIVVQNADDAGGATACSLRQAIVSMNTGTVTGTGCVNSGAAFGTGDTINFDSSVFPFGANTITLADSSGSTLTITDANLTIAARPYAPVTIQRDAAAANKFRVLYDSAPDGGSLTLSGLTLRNGDASSGPSCNGKNGGGGICILNADLTLTNSTVTDNYAVGYSGGILSRAGNVTLTNSTVSNNTSSQFAGGIYVFNKTLTLTNSTVSGNAALDPQLSYGGGIFSQSAAIVMNNSTVSGNSAAYAGGMWSWSGNVTLTNSTVSGNSGTVVQRGGNGNAGGIWTGSGAVALYNSTVSANSAASNNGGIQTGGGGLAQSIHAVNSIIAGNSGPGGDTNSTLDGTSTNNIVATDPQLGALADNGGPTKTMLPKANSSAVDAGSDGANCQATDQRGVKRPQGAHCDIGAVELMTAQIANPDLLFTNWSAGINFNGPYLFTGGGDCSFASCFAVGDNFSNGDHWIITSFNVYMISANGNTGGNWRYALFDAAGNQIVAPTNAIPTFTDLGLFTGPYSGTYEVYQLGISGLNIDLPPGQYQLRFTNTQVQSVYPAFGIQTSAQTISPGFVQLTGSSTVEALLSTDVTQRTQEWAFDLSGKVVSIFKNGFEGP